MKYFQFLIPLLLISVIGYADTEKRYIPKTRCCITDPQHYYFEDPEKIRSRFALYKSNGINTIRMEIDWASIERKEGDWNPSSEIKYLKIAEEFGFRVKLIMGVMMAPPAWYLDKNPEAMLVDQNGLRARNCMSYWYPDLKKIIDSKTKKICDDLKANNLWHIIDYVIPTFGPAGEPIYPHPWTLAYQVTEETFWGYDVNAHKDFRSHMKRKYKSVEKANKAWGTDFDSWDDVIVFQPKTYPGQYWNDMLVWYRDVKRKYINWQIDNTRKHIGDKIVLMYVPGTCYTEDHWNEAVRTGEGNVWIKLMADSKFLIDTAVEKDCWLQYTGVDNAPEVALLRKYIDDKGYTDLVMWGENAGALACAKDPVFLAETIIANRLYGLDYTHAHFALEDDGVTPNAIMPELRKAYRMINGYWYNIEMGSK